MPTPVISDEKLISALIAFEESGGNQSEAARRAGLDRSTFRGRLICAFARFPDRHRSMIAAALRGTVGGPPIPEAATPPEGFVIRQNSAQYGADGTLQKQWIKTGQGVPEGWQPPAGHVVKGESALIGPAGNLMAKWVKTRESSAPDLVEALRATFAEYDGAAPALPMPENCEDDVLTVYLIPDLHLGMYAWAAETGADYDVKIATKIATDSLHHLVSQSRPSRHAIVLVLGDFFHANDQKNVTPGSGHQLDVDTRYASVYRSGCDLLARIVDMVAAKHEQTELKVLPGNHDPDAAVTLGVALSMFYSREDRITVNLSPGVTWYRRFGQNLLGANHGHTMKTAEIMAGAMAVDCREDWGATIHRFIWTGHLHHEKIKEALGVRVETLSSPAARDAWNAASGYRSNRALQGITVHRDRGEIGRHRVNISGATAA